MKKTLGIIISEYAEKKGKKLVKYPESLNFLLKFSHLFKKYIVMLNPVQTKNKSFYNFTVPDNIEWVIAPGWHRHKNFFLRFIFIINATLKKIKYTVKNSQILFIRFPNPLTFFILQYARIYKRKTIIFISGNIRYNKYTLKKGILSYLAYFISILFEKITKNFYKKTTFLTAGEVLKRMYFLENRTFNFLDIIVEKIAKPKPLLTNKQIKILFVGRFFPGKGLFVLLEAFKKLKKYFSNIKLILAGDGILFEDVKTWIKKNRLTKDIALTGWITKNKLYSLYETSTVFVLPSDGSEGIPRSIIEAMSMGTPCISTKVGGIPYFFKENQNILLAKPGSINDLFNNLKTLITNKDLYHTLSMNGIKLAKDYLFINQEKRIKELFL